jgi:hypothetical protein
MFFNEKLFEGDRSAQPRSYRIPHVAPIPRAAPPAVSGTRLPAGIALAIMTILALGLWGFIIFVFRALILG